MIYKRARKSFYNKKIMEKDTLLKKILTRMIISKISLDPLDKSRKEVLFKLNPFFKKGAILAGGTALMLQFF